MSYRRRIYFTSEQKSEIWDRWQSGESMSSIGRGFDRNSSSIYPLLSRTGGIRPPVRKRSRLALTLVEREEISRVLEARLSLRCIARQLQRSASTISREVKRNGGVDQYRAVRSDQASWERAHRPKPCKLACNRALSRTVSRKLQMNWSPEQIAGWLKREYRGEKHNQVSHETIYRSLVCSGARCAEEGTHAVSSFEAYDTPLQTCQFEARGAGPDKGRYFNQAETRLGGGPCCSWSLGRGSHWRFKEQLYSYSC